MVTDLGSPADSTSAWRGRFLSVKRQARKTPNATDPATNERRPRSAVGILSFSFRVNTLGLLFRVGEFQEVTRRQGNQRMSSDANMSSNLPDLAAPALAHFSPSASAFNTTTAVEVNSGGSFSAGGITRRCGIARNHLSANGTLIGQVKFIRESAYYSLTLSIVTAGYSSILGSFPPRPQNAARTRRAYCTGPRYWSSQSSVCLMSSFLGMLCPVS
jgi:hypothetical protein